MPCWILDSQCNSRSIFAYLAGEIYDDPKAWKTAQGLGFFFSFFFFPFLAPPVGPFLASTISPTATAAGCVGDDVSRSL